jgi:endonuclease/exonuclease/phosphatase family metal-dependent hydrolase
MRIATYNIKNGLDLEKGRTRNSGLREAIASLDVDVLALQEVDTFRPRSFFRHQPAMMRRAGKFDHHVFGKTMREDLIGGYGNALLVRGKLSDVEMFKLPGTPGHEPRGAILGTIEAGGQRISFATAHLQNRRKVWDEKLLESPEQLRAVLAALRTREGPRVLVGDFNLYANIVTPILTQAGFVEVEHGPTYPVDKPDRSIDYIALDGMRAVSVDVVRLPVGDHRPGVVELEPTAQRLSTPQARPAEEEGVKVRATVKRSAPAKRKTATKQAPSTRKPAKKQPAKKRR